MSNRSLPTKSLFAAAATILQSDESKGKSSSAAAEDEEADWSKSKSSSADRTSCSKSKPNKYICDDNKNDHDDKNVSRDERAIETNDLENLCVSMPSSTLDAILAIQQTHRPQSVLQNGSGDSQGVERSLRLSPNLFQSNDEKDQDSRKIKWKRKRKNKKKKRKRKYSDSQSSSSSRSSSPIGTVFLENKSPLHRNMSFQIDRRANKNLLINKSVSKYHLAKYRLASRGCIGNDNILADVHYGDGYGKKKNVVSRYFGRERKKTRVEFYPCLKGSSAVSNLPEFIRFEEEGDKNMNNSNIGSYSVLDEATSLYAQGKGMDDNNQSQDDFVMDELFEKVAKFNKKLRDEPNNIGLWLDFVKFQDVVAMEDKSFKRQTLHLYDVYRPTKSVIEKKLSILEKALALNPSSLELKLKQLEFYQDIWEAEKVEKAWEDLLFVHSSDINLWRHYLCRQQSNLRTFSFSRMVKKYHKCFQTLIPIFEGQVKVVNMSKNMEQELIGLFNQYCCFMHQSGYTERAVTSFQAIIEMNLFGPPDLNLSSDKERLSRFEQFWESSTPKFGDRHAKGWAEWEKKKHVTDLGFLPVSTEEEEDNILLASLPKSTTWLKMEKTRCKVNWLPWKPDETKGETEDNCEDPDRLVLFEDISPALFRVTKSESCMQLVCIFLSFLGLKSNMIEKVVGSVNGGKVSLCDGYVLEQLYQTQIKSSSKLCSVFGSNWNPHQCLIEFINEVILQCESYFSSSNRDIFTLVRFDIEFRKIGVSDIHTLSTSKSKEIKKFGKSLLKESQNRNNLVVWENYIRLLWVISEKMEETVSMIEVALKMFLGSNSLKDPKKAKGVCLLCRTFAEIMLNFDPNEYVAAKGRHSAPSTEDKIQVIGCIGALVDGTKYNPQSKVDSSPLFILRIKKRASTILDNFLSDVEKDTSVSSCDTAMAFLQCYVLLEYCTSNFKHANEIFIHTCVHIKERSTNFLMQNFLKDLYISQLNFILNVMHVETIPLLHLRNVIDTALPIFPDCIFFHKTFLDVESRSFISGRLRRFYDQQLKSSPSVTNVVYASLSEMMRLERMRQEDILQLGVAESGLVNRIRSIFQHGLEIPACTHSPLLWRMWVAFEVQHGTMNGAKGIMYRALQSCPWNKSIYMDGVEYFGDEELVEMSDLMAEKELRVCMPLEEVDLLMTAEKKSDGEADDMDTSMNEEMAGLSDNDSNK